MLGTTERQGKMEVRDVSCVDHRGTSFLDEKQMCAYWGVKLLTFRRRIKDGWTLEEALTKKTGRIT